MRCCNEFIVCVSVCLSIPVNNLRSVVGSLFTAACVPYQWWNLWKQNNVSFPSPPTVICVQMVEWDPTSPSPFCDRLLPAQSCGEPCSDDHRYCELKNASHVTARSQLSTSLSYLNFLRTVIQLSKCWTIGIGWSKLFGKEQVRGYFRRRKVRVVLVSGREPCHVCVKTGTAGAYTNEHICVPVKLYVHWSFSFKL